MSIVDAQWDIPSFLLEWVLYNPELTNHVEEARDDNSGTRSKSGKQVNLLWKIIKTEKQNFHKIFKHHFWVEGIWNPREVSRGTAINVANTSALPCSTNAASFTRVHTYNPVKYSWRKNQQWNKWTKLYLTGSLYGSKDEEILYFGQLGWSWRIMSKDNVSG